MGIQHLEEIMVMLRMEMMTWQVMEWETKEDKANIMDKMIQS